VSEALAGVGKADNAFATLSNFEKSVAKQEATAKAFNELANSGTDASLEAEFAKLSGHTVDDDLAALKRERSISVTVQKELPAAGSK
jgi:phage shock protein A